MSTDLGGAAPIVVGQVAYTTPGSYSWTCPAGVTSVSVVCVGAGASGYSDGGARSGGAGGLAYRNNISVTPGSTYTVVVGAPGIIDANITLRHGTSSYFVDSSTMGYGGQASTAVDSGGVGGTFSGQGGGNGGSGDNFDHAGGGAGGYSGNGGNGAYNPGGGGSGGGGGGGASGGYGSGGGVGILGQGASGGGADNNSYHGQGGSGGAAGSSSNAGSYGGGGGNSSPSTYGGGGAVRIIWPGTLRQFPSTRTGNE